MRTPGIGTRKKRFQGLSGGGKKRSVLNQNNVRKPNKPKVKPI